MSEGNPEVDSLTVLFGGLELTIRRRPGQPRTDTAEDFELVVPPRTGPVRATYHEIVAASTLEPLIALDIPELLPLSRRLTGAAARWTGWATVVRAYRVGVGARLHLEGSRKISSPLPACGIASTSSFEHRA